MSERNPYRLMRPTAISGGARKAQMKAIRAAASDWDRRFGKPHYALTTPPPPEGLWCYCRCGHAWVVEGDPEELARFRWPCGRCNNKV